MRRASEAYIVYKRQADDLWNFAVMVCYAVPTLKKNVKHVKAAAPGYALVKNDFFIHDVIDEDGLLALTVGYKAHLAQFLWFASFSFFEAYVGGVLEELLAFHGGTDAFIKSAKDIAAASFLPLADGAAKARRKLHGPFNPKKRDQYDKYRRELRAANYRFPSDLLAAYGVPRWTGEIRPTADGSKPANDRDPRPVRFYPAASSFCNA